MNANESLIKDALKIGVNHPIFRKGVLKEQKIELFRSLFKGREWLQTRPWRWPGQPHLAFLPKESFAKYSRNCSLNGSSLVCLALKIPAKRGVDSLETQSVKGIELYWRTGRDSNFPYLFLDAWEISDSVAARWQRVQRFKEQHHYLSGFETYGLEFKLVMLRSLS